ncbi:hypothetical protein E2C01_062826 [Portunus trituberculatus]|uniref:Uncharacterized protein n=1 Tax=Portunus trituberculatus TaxID=210409 RepID=A0A5B7HET6_PORTR|nr:hypothetical protein [Portunus trituberculatus]
MEVIVKRSKSWSGSLVDL